GRLRALPGGRPAGNRRPREPPGAGVHSRRGSGHRGAGRPRAPRRAAGALLPPVLVRVGGARALPGAGARRRHDARSTDDRGSLDRRRPGGPARARLAPERGRLSVDARALARVRGRGRLGVGARGDRADLPPARRRAVGHRDRYARGRPRRARAAEPPGHDDGAAELVARAPGVARGAREAPAAASDRRRAPRSRGRRGEVPWFQKAPGSQGHEMCGRVAKLGARRKADSLGRPLRDGDRVAYAYFIPCGECWACLGGTSGCPNRYRTRNTLTADDPPHFLGAFAEYYLLKATQWIFKVPDGLPDELVAPVNCALSQVVYGLQQIGVWLGDTVVVQGAGGLGIYACG